MVQKPVGISIIAVLEALGGVLLFIFAAFFAALSTAGSFWQDLIETYGTTYIPNIGDLITAIALGIAAVFVIFGILAFVCAYGLWTGKGWTWYLSVILLVLGLIGSLLSLAANPVSGIVGLVIAGLLLWYFFRPYVKDYFGLGPAHQPPPTPPP